MTTAYKYRQRVWGQYLVEVWTVIGTGAMRGTRWRRLDDLMGPSVRVRFW